MTLQKLDLGQRIDVLTSGELRDSFARKDSAQRALLAGVKSTDAFYNLGFIGASVNVFTTPVNMVGAGYVWAIMNVGAEMSVSSAIRIYKQTPILSGIAPTGNGRPVISTSGAVSTGAQLSKGQLMLRGGDQLTLVGVSGNILSVFITAIEVAAERIGELLL